MIKKWKINEKNEKLEPRKDRWVDIPKMQKTSSFFHLFFIFFIFFFISFFFHFSVLCSDSLDFAKCSSLFPIFVVENAAKHRKSMKKTKNMMKNG